MAACSSAAIDRAAALIGAADALVFAAGAGMGVDSGLPDFRGREGFWRAYPALADAGLDFHRIASPRAFEQHPGLAWGFYGHRLALYRQTPPHAGFAVLHRWAGRAALGARVFTSNVDGQFQRAGFAAQQVHECHGSLHHLQCTRPCSDAIWPADGFTPEVDTARCLLLNAPPRCPRCGALARPNVLMFGDPQWIDAREQAQSACLTRWLQAVVRNRARLVVIEIGAGTAVPSVRMASQQLMHAADARLVRINPREADVPGRDAVGLPISALGALCALDERLACRQAQAERKKKPARGGSKVTAGCGGDLERLGLSVSHSRPRA